MLTASQFIGMSEYDIYILQCWMRIAPVWNSKQATASKEAKNSKQKY